MNKEQLNTADIHEAASKWADEHVGVLSEANLREWNDVLNSFYAGYAQWQLEQKQVVSDEEIEKLIDDNFKASLADNNGEPLYTDADLQQGFKSALQYSESKSFYCWHKDATDEEPCKEQCDICKNSKAINK